MPYFHGKNDNYIVRVNHIYEYNHYLLVFQCAIKINTHTVCILITRDLASPPQIWAAVGGARGVRNDCVLGGNSLYIALAHPCLRFSFPSGSLQYHHDLPGVHAEYVWGVRAWGVRRMCMRVLGED